MPHEPSVLEVNARRLLAVRRRIRWDQIGEVAMPSLDRVWSFIRGQAIEGVGANIFVYRGLGAGGADVSFGVEVPAAVEPPEGLIIDATPAGRAATVTHIGPYDRIVDSNRLLRDWCEAHKERLSGISWEIYGDWSDNPATLRTDIYHLLKDSENP